MRGPHFREEQITIDPLTLLTEIRDSLQGSAVLPDAFVNDITACLEANTVPDITPELAGDAAALAHALIRTLRIKKRAAVTVKAAGSATTKMIEPMLDHMKHNRWPTSGKVAGANLHRKVDLFASPVVNTINGEDVHDHDALTRVVKALHEAEPSNNWDQLLPSKVNGQTLASTFREYLTNHDFTLEQALLPVEERLVIAGCPKALVDAAKITEKPTVNANSL